MSQTAKAQEPSMEEILASIRRIIADDDAGKPAQPAESAAPRPQAVPPPPRPAPPRPPAASTPTAAPQSGAMNQSEVDAMLSDLEDKKTMPPESSDILDLTESMTAPSPQPASAANFRTIDGQSDVVFAERRPDAPPEPSARMADDPRRSGTEGIAEHSLLSGNASAAVDHAFNTLAHTVLSQNARTLDDLVREMLRPMLKAWLDDNLPGMVDRIVRAEIERVSRGRP